MFLFFFMEETNYHRKPSIPTLDACSTLPASPVKASELDEKDPDTVIDQELHSIEQGSRLTSSSKTYLQKIALFQKADLKQPNHLVGIITRPLIFLSFPVIFYAGFSYGSNLIVSSNPSESHPSIISIPRNMYSSSPVVQRPQRYHLSYPRWQAI